MLFEYFVSLCWLFSIFEYLILRGWRTGRYAYASLKWKQYKLLIHDISLQTSWPPMFFQSVLICDTLFCLVLLVFPKYMYICQRSSIRSIFCNNNTSFKILLMPMVYLHHPYLTYKNTRYPLPIKGGGGEIWENPAKMINIAYQRIYWG